MNNQILETPNNYNQGDEINLRELFGIIWRFRWLIIGSTLLAGILAGAISMSMPNIYRSRALLVPADESQGGGLAALSGQFGAFASLAGVSLGKGEASKTIIAMEVLKSRAFVAGFVQRRRVAVPLMAGKKWDAENNQMVINAEVYNSATQQWIGNDAESEIAPPSDWDIYKRFISIVSVMQDNKTGLITLTVDSVSPTLAQQWGSWLIEDVNAHVRQMDVDEASKSIEYLRQQLEKTSIKEMQQIFFQLIEKQTQVIMLANVRDQYAFKVIDPPVVPQEKQGPRRALIVLVTMMAMGLLCVAGVLVRNSMQGSWKEDSDRNG